MMASASPESGGGAATMYSRLQDEIKRDALRKSDLTGGN